MDKKGTAKKQSPKTSPKAVQPATGNPKPEMLTAKMKTVIGLAGVIVLLAGYVFFQPDSFTVQRQMTIQAPVSKIFSRINNFHNWNAWSPWAKLDPAMTSTFEGPVTGQGAVYNWAGNDKVGQGKMVLTESERDIHITIALTYLKPDESNFQTTFYFTPKGKETNVRWIVTGKNDFFDKLDLVLNPDKMDKRFGADLQKGLAQLKTAAE